MWASGLEFHRQLLDRRRSVFTSSESYIKQIRLPYSVYIYRSAWSKLIIFAHNFVIYFGVLLYFEFGRVRWACLLFRGLALSP